MQHLISKYFASAFFVLALSSCDSGSTTTPASDSNTSNNGYRMYAAASRPSVQTNYVSLPASFQAEDYASMNGIETSGTNDSGGGDFVGWINHNDYTMYNIRVPETGTYEVKARVSSKNSGDIDFLVSGREVGSLSVARTGGWKIWRTKTTEIELSEGSHTLQLNYTGNPNDYLLDINWFSIALVGSDAPQQDREENDSANTSYVRLPAVIQAEDFASKSGADTPSNNEYLGWIEDDNYSTYNISVPQSGTYEVSAKVASNNSGTINFLVSDRKVGSIPVDSTGGWTIWRTKTTEIELSGGDQTLKLKYTGDSGEYLLDIDWFSLNLVDSNQNSDANYPVTDDESNGSYTEVISDKFDLEGGSDNVSPFKSNGTLVFDAVDARHVTSGGNGWRHELKMKRNLRVPMDDFTETLSATVTPGLSDATKVIFAQYHASGSGTLVKMYLSDTSETGHIDNVADNGVFDVYGRFKVDGDEVIRNFGTIRRGRSFDFSITNDRGLVTVTAFGVSETERVDDGGKAYMKFGSYLIAQNPFNRDNIDEDDWDDFYNDFDINSGEIKFSDVFYESSL